jgi:hypothetical protein
VTDSDADIALSIAPPCGPEKHDPAPDALRPSAWFQAMVAIHKHPDNPGFPGVDPGPDDTTARLLATLEAMTQDPWAAGVITGYVKFLVGEKLWEFARRLRDAPNDPTIAHWL